MCTWGSYYVLIKTSSLIKGKKLCTDITIILIKIFGLLCYPITEGHVDTFRIRMRIYLSLIVRCLWVVKFCSSVVFYISVIIILSDGNYRSRGRKEKRMEEHMIDEVLWSVYNIWFYWSVTEECEKLVVWPSILQTIQLLLAVGYETTSKRL